MVAPEEHEVPGAADLAEHVPKIRGGGREGDGLFEQADQLRVGIGQPFQAGRHGPYDLFGLLDSLSLGLGQVHRVRLRQEPDAAVQNGRVNPVLAEQVPDVLHIFGSQGGRQHSRSEGKARVFGPHPAGTEDFGLHLLYEVGLIAGSGA